MLPSRMTIASQIYEIGRRRWLVANEVQHKNIRANVGGSDLVAGGSLPVPQSKTT